MQGAEWVKGRTHPLSPDCQHLVHKDTRMPRCYPSTQSGCHSGTPACEPSMQVWAHEGLLCRMTFEALGGLGGEASSHTF